MPSATVENYLKEIYSAQQNAGNQPVGMGEVARLLSVVPGTATTMVKSMANDGWLDYEPRVGVRLTDRGEAVALRILRRHRLIELFLVRTLGLDWSAVHEEAEDLEHAISDRVLDRLDAFLGYPKADPHGDPIPTASGKIDERELDNLANCPLEQKVAISRVTDQDSDFLKYIDAQGLRPGTLVMVIERSTAADAASLRIYEGGVITLGLTAAEKILVE